MLFMHKASGSLETICRSLVFAYGDYLVIPCGTIYQLVFDYPQNRLLIVESFSAIHFPKQYTSKNGQLLEQSPFCERDIRPHRELVTMDGKGDFLVKQKKQGRVYCIHHGHHPFDVVGRGGCCYPFAFNIHDFEPIGLNVWCTGGGWCTGPVIGSKS